MQEFGGVFYPDHEVHLIDWCRKHGVSMFGRTVYQGRKQEAAYALCQKLGRQRTAIDVGGHAGTWSMNMVRHFAHVHAFEPVAEHRECFEANVTAENATLYACALGDRAGTVSMDLERGNTGNSSVSTGAGGDIELKTLDSFGFENVDFIKTDVEGFELAVLMGAAQTISRWRPVVIVEQKRRMSEKYGFPMLSAVQFLKDQGYKVAADLGGDYLMAPSEALK